MSATGPALVRTMSAQLTALLRERILDGHYGSGSALLQDQLAAEFGVSKIPVREALVQLTAEGLVDTHAHRGFQVRPTSRAELDELFRLRLNLEPELVVAGARIASADDHAAARQALAALDAAIRTGSSHAGALNRGFHLALLTPAQQPIGSEILGRLLALAQRYVVKHLAPAGRGKRARAEHAELLSLWQAGDARPLSRAVRTHVEATWTDLRNAYPE